jgi:hypothetical protein
LDYFDRWKGHTEQAVADKVVSVVFEKINVRDYLMNRSYFTTNAYLAFGGAKVGELIEFQNPGVSCSGYLFG